MKYPQTQKPQPPSPAHHRHHSSITYPLPRFLLLRFMELIETSNLASEDDAISNMPNIVITNILDRLPLQDAMRTSILSRSWRFKWAMLSQLIFDEKFYEYLLEKKHEDSYGRIIIGLLKRFVGAITKIVLYIYENPTAEEINSLFLLLSRRKGIKDLTLTNMDDTIRDMPTHLFSCLELKHLIMENFNFNYLPTCHAFPNLLTLELHLFDVDHELGDLFTRCPLLEVLKLSIAGEVGTVKLVEITKLDNLKILYLALCVLTPKITSSCTIFELVESLPKLEKLNLDFTHCKLTEVGAKKRFPTIFPGLKALKLKRIDLDSDIMVSCFFEMVKSFPNLQILEIAATEFFDTLRTCSQFRSPEIYTMGLLQLQSVVFTYYDATMNDLYLIKYLLACSPALKRIVIHSWRSSFPGSDRKLVFARMLLKLRRASPVVDIDFF